MLLTTEELPNGVTRAALNGRLDIAGSADVDLKLNVLAGSKKKLILDLAEVSFVASIGMRLLVVCAKTVAIKGGKIALLSPVPNVETVLTTAGIDAIVPIQHDLASAVAAVSA
jgi:anti-anti-sigma factor